MLSVNDSVDTVELESGLYMCKDVANILSKLVGSLIVAFKESSVIICSVYVKDGFQIV